MTLDKFVKFGVDPKQLLVVENSKIKIEEETYILCFKNICGRLINKINNSNHGYLFKESEEEDDDDISVKIVELKTSVFSNTNKNRGVFEKFYNNYELRKI